MAVRKLWHVCPFFFFWLYVLVRLEWDFETPDGEVEDVIFGLKGFIFLLFLYCSVLYFASVTVHRKNDGFTKQILCCVLIFMDPSSYWILLVSFVDDPACVWIGSQWWRCITCFSPNPVNFMCCPRNDTSPDFTLLPWTPNPYSN